MATIFLNTGTGAGGIGASTTTLQVVFDFFQGQNGEAVNYSLYNPESPVTVQSINLISGANTINTTVCPALATAAGCLFCRQSATARRSPLRASRVTQGSPSPSPAPQLHQLRCHAAHVIRAHGEQHAHRSSTGLRVASRVE